MDQIFKWYKIFKIKGKINKKKRWKKKDEREQSVRWWKWMEVVEKGA